MAASRDAEAGTAGTRQWLAIADQGPGLAVTPRGDHFPGPSTKTRGSGLGIPFAYKICELHDGELSFAPGADGGTVVTVSVPAAFDGA